MNLQTIHPFPARMAPEIAFEAISQLQPKSIVLDPMMGSGTSLRVALEHGHDCIGTDVDPLAILISCTWNTAVNTEVLISSSKSLIEGCKQYRDIEPDWWDAETKKFINFWFTNPQLNSLSQLAIAITKEKDTVLANAYKIALSKCIITKDKGASLARDVSHAKPHKVRTSNDFNVFDAFAKAVNHIAKRLFEGSPSGILNIYHNDARSLTSISDKSIDCIITSPPYLHAVDYFRGHKLSLVWLGYSIEKLRQLRSKSIGIQKYPDAQHDTKVTDELLKNVGDVDSLPNNKRQHLNKYALDIYQMCKEYKRVLQSKRKATVVIADSWSSGVFIKNTQLIKNAAYLAGLNLVTETTRCIPANKRYLPPPEYITNSSLDKRMKMESVITFLKP